MFEDGVTAVTALVEAIIASHHAVRHSLSRGVSRTRTVRTPVPTEACYHINLSTTLKAWFGVESVDYEIPLSTLFYRPEADHLGDLMRLWVRSDVK